MTRRALAWPIGITLVLALTVGVNVWVAVVANDDPSFSIEQDYYRKAVDWDKEMEQESENQRLAWRAEPTLGAYTLRYGAPLQLRLVDADGKPISGAVVKVKAFFNARAGQVFEATMRATAPDTYRVTLPVNHSGQWELQFDVSHENDRFTSSARLEAMPAEGR